MRTLVILGARGHAKVVFATLQDMASPGWNVLGFLDDDPALGNSKLLGLPVLGKIALLNELATAGKIQGALVGVSCGHMPVRARLFDKIRSLDLEVPSIISPTAFVHPTARIGTGAAIFAGAIVHAFATVGDNFTAYSNAVVEHECELGNNVYLGPGVNFCSNVRVSNNTFIATGASVICPLVGEDVIVGAGSTVVGNVPDGAVVAGVPARILRLRTMAERSLSYQLRRENRAA